MWNKLLEWLAPIQKLMQAIGKNEPLMQEWQVDECLELIKEGDILLSYESQRLTSYFIKGDYDHAAIVSSKLSVVEAVKPKSKEVPLKQWLYNKDSVVIIRAIVPDHVRKLAAASALYYVGAEYDYGFSSTNSKLYCSELCYICYASNYASFMPKLKHNNLLPIKFLDHALKGDGLILVKEFRNH